jgi:hypothetical protein
MLWKNSKGRTAEIDRVPQEKCYLWRLSCATISADGEFSLFPGFDRLLIVISGEGVFLNETKLEPLNSFRFSGERPIDCRLIAGEVVDLGLIFDREKIRAEMVCFSGAVPELQAAESPLATYVFDLESWDTHKDVTNCPVNNGVFIALFGVGQ